MKKLTFLPLLIILGHLHFLSAFNEMEQKCVDQEMAKQKAYYLCFYSKFIPTAISVLHKLNVNPRKLSKKEEQSFKRLHRLAQNKVITWCKFEAVERINIDLNVCGKEVLRRLVRRKRACQKQLPDATMQRTVKSEEARRRLQTRHDHFMELFVKQEIDYPTAMNETESIGIQHAHKLSQYMDEFYSLMKSKCNKWK